MAEVRFESGHMAGESTLVTVRLAVSSGASPTCVLESKVSLVATALHKAWLPGVMSAEMVG